MFIYLYGYFCIILYVIKRKWYEWLIIKKIGWFNMILFFMMLKRLFKGIFYVFKDFKFFVFFILIVVILLLGILFYICVEGLYWIDVFYFCVVILMMVGYFEFVFIIGFSKVFIVIYMYVGIGFIFVMIVRIIVGILFFCKL